MPLTRPLQKRSKAAKAQRGAFAAQAETLEAKQRRAAAAEAETRHAARYKARRRADKVAGNSLLLQAPLVDGAFDSDSEREEGAHLPPGLRPEDALLRAAERDAEESPLQAAARLAAARARSAAAGGVFFALRGREGGGGEAPRATAAAAAGLALAEEGAVRALLRTLPATHEAARARATRARAADCFPRWQSLLSAGFNVLLYGVGSKEQVLRDFIGSTLIKANDSRSGACLLVQGGAPGLTARLLLANCLQALALPPGRPAPASGPAARLAAEEALRRIERGSRAPRRLFILVNGIDGASLRGGEAQALLARLASLPRVHLVASCDHVNAPLLWDKMAAARLRWAWECCHTYAPLLRETRGAPPLLRPTGEARLRRGAASVLLSLTTNARTVFRVLSEEQLKGAGAGGDAHGGLPFARWFDLCRTTFAVSSDGQLRAYLMEFVDHGLVKRVRRADGADAVVITLGDDALKQLLEDIGSS